MLSIFLLTELNKTKERMCVWKQALTRGSDYVYGWRRGKKAVCNMMMKIFFGVLFIFLLLSLLDHLLPTDSAKAGAGAWSSNQHSVYLWKGAVPPLHDQLLILDVYWGFIAFTRLLLPDVVRQAGKWIFTRIFYCYHKNRRCVQYCVLFCFFVAGWLWWWGTAPKKIKNLYNTYSITINPDESTKNLDPNGSVGLELELQYCTVGYYTTFSTLNGLSSIWICMWLP